MLPTRSLFSRPALRLLHYATPRPQQLEPTNQEASASPKTEDDAYKAIIDAVENSPNTRKGATVTQPQAPHEIFDAWNECSFYAPLAFLRSRRMRASPKRKAPPAVGPGAAEAAEGDPYLQLDIDPVYEANNPVLLSEFVSSMGKIRPRSSTRLSWRSQRKLTQAIKRSKQKGVLPIAARPRVMFIPRAAANEKT